MQEWGVIRYEVCGRDEVSRARDTVQLHLVARSLHLSNALWQQSYLYLHCTFLQTTNTNSGYLTTDVEIPGSPSLHSTITEHL